MTTALDLDDTTRCPVRSECDCCGARAELAVATADSPMGVLCLTLCEPCADECAVPLLPVGALARMVGAHCTHLGCDLDEMAAALERGR